MGPRQASHLTIGSTAHWPILAKRRPVRVPVRRRFVLSSDTRGVRHVQPQEDGGRSEMARLVSTRGLLAMVALSVAVVVAGCAALTPVPYNGRESCQGVGGTYTSDGRCLAGNV